MAKFAYGTYTGDTAAQNISLGWKPDYVKVINYTDGDATWEYTSGMTDGHAIYTRQIADNGTTSNTNIAKITSNGISAYAGSSTSGSEAAEGFTIGTALSESAKVFHYIAFAEDEKGAG